MFTRRGSGASTSQGAHPPQMVSVKHSETWDLTVKYRALMFQVLGHFLFKMVVAIPFKTFLSSLMIFPLWHSLFIHFLLSCLIMSVAEVCCLRKWISLRRHFLEECRQKNGQQMCKQQICVFTVHLENLDDWSWRCQFQLGFKRTYFHVSSFAFNGNYL